MPSFFCGDAPKGSGPKILAPMGTSKASSLSVWLQNWFEVRSLLKVLPLSFSPSPKVHSEVILLTRRAYPCMPVENIQKWEQCLKKLFFAPRKMLRSKWADKARYPLLNTKRASDLSWEEHAELFCAFQNSPSFFL